MDKEFEILLYKNEQMKTCANELLEVIDLLTSLKLKRMESPLRYMKKFNNLPWYRKMFFQFNIPADYMYQWYLDEFDYTDIYLFKENDKINTKLNNVKDKLRALGLDC